MAISRHEMHEQVVAEDEEITQLAVLLVEILELLGPGELVLVEVLTEE